MLISIYYSYIDVNIIIINIDILISIYYSYINVIIINIDISISIFN